MEFFDYGKPPSISSLLEDSASEVTTLEVGSSCMYRGCGYCTYLRVFMAPDNVCIKGIQFVST